MIEDIYVEALLAAASYADWSVASSDADRKAELKNNRGFTDAQLDDLFFGSDPKYTVYGGPSNGYIELANGFSATIFENIEAGDLSVAFRGTEPSWPYVDFITDILALLGNPDGVLEDIFNQSDNISDFLDSNNLLQGGQLTE